jgi:hypothetical protein
MTQTHYERTYLHLVPKVRHTFQEWERQRMLDIHVELQVLRKDLARLKRASTRVERCHQCRCLSTITICDDGAYRCQRCLAVPKEASA